MNVVFLDYDGVVNTAMWDDNGIDCRFNFPSDNKVNNFQAVQWVSEFCERYNYDIVVTSTWRVYDNYIECLRNGGLRGGIAVLGRTPEIHGGTRGDEVMAYLQEHTEIDNFIIFDDYSDMGCLSDHLILCDTRVGFGMPEFYKALELHTRMQLEKERTKF